MSIDRSISAGRFDQRIYIELLYEVPDSFGQVSYGAQGPTGTWTKVTECWAHIEDLYGIEQKQSSRELSEQWSVIQVRYHAGLGITTAMRARHKVYGTKYDIRSVMLHVEDGRKMVEMTCVVTD